ncbi:MAG: ATP-binding cassette domain-containing protein [Treponema sp.]|nr:ATP-binding cassette domain-containing protein [Treponema sp.]
MNAPDLSIEKLCFSFGEKTIFENFSLALGGEAAAGTPRDNPLVILGASGCGKTTLLRLMAGLLRPDAGEIALRGGGSGGGAAAGGAAGKPDSGGPACSFVFQEPRLLPWKTALANVSLPIEGLLGRKEARERARRYLGLVSMEDFCEAFPEELSGGQKQRVNIARAFACPGSLLLMDEPFQSLDIPLRRHLLDLTKKLLESSPRRLVAVTHDPREALYLGRRVIVLGRPPRGIVLDLNPEENLSPAERAELEDRIPEAMEL